MKALFSCVLLMSALFITSCGSSKTPKTPSRPDRVNKQYTTIERMYRDAQLTARAKDFKKAYSLYDKVIQQDPDYLDAYLMKAGLYYSEQNWAEARKNFEIVRSKKPDYNPEIYFSLALINAKEKKFDAAAEQIKTYLGKIDSDHPKFEKAEEYLEKYSYISHAMKNPVNFKKERLPFPINSDHSEYVPSFTVDGSQLIFVRRVYQQEDLYVSEFQDGKFSIPKAIEELSTAYNEGVHTMSGDGNTLIFTGCNQRTSYGSCDLYYSKKKKDGTWGKSSNMGKIINSAAWDSQPSITADGQTLYFSSSRAGSIGGRDIWVARKDATGRWKYPENLSSAINTLSNEETPFIHADGRTLYFRSSGHQGMGGYDLFMSTYDPEIDEWSIPVNLGYPINTEADEGGLSVDISGKIAYYSSNEGQTDVDIWRFPLPEKYRPLEVTFVKASVIDAETRLPLAVDILISDYKEKLYLQKETNLNGIFLHALPLGKTYGLTVEKQGYIFHSEKFELEEVNKITNPFILSIELQPIKDLLPVTSKPIVLNNIFFETGSAVLQEISNREIIRLSELLKQNGQGRITITGHTDNIGTAADNLALSLARAESVKTALTALGIKEGRIGSEGKGETEPISSNDTEAGRQKNRRTEFMIFK